MSLHNMSQYISTTELASLLGVSRVTIFKKIKKGEIKAVRIGRNYVIDKMDVPGMTVKKINKEQKREIDDAIKKTVDEYGETLRLLGKE